MKVTRIITLLAASALVLAGCAKTSDIEDLQDQIDALKSDRIQTVEGQIKSIQTSITSLQNTDNALQTYITALQTQTAKLEKTDSELVSAIEKLKTDLYSEISSAKTELLNKLESEKNSLQNQINDINSQITALEAKDADLQAQIDELKTYVGSGIQDAKDWAEASFATLEQYNTTAGIVATIQSQIETINAEIEEMKTNFAGKDELNSAISASEISLKNWVNGQLTGYYIISQMDGKLTTLQTGLEGQLATQKAELEAKINALEDKESDNYKELTAQLDTVNSAINKNTALIEQLKADLDAQKTEITAAYKSAIEEAINMLDGKLSGEIANKISDINATISTLASRVSSCEDDIKSIKTTIATILQNMENMQTQISALLARIQSISYVPKYSDGKAMMTYTDNGTITAGKAVFDYQLKPASAASEIAALWNSTTGSSAITMNAVYTITKSAPEIVQLSIESITADSGFITVTVSGESLKDEFFLGKCSAGASLCISDGNNDLSTEYVQMSATEVIDFSDAKFKDYCIENFDVDRNGEISAVEAEAVKEIDCSNAGLTSVDGIEYFTNLESLDVSNNAITSLDVSNNPSLASLNVNCTHLSSLKIIGTVDSLIGQYIVCDEIKGVIFYASNTVKIVSNDETEASWDYYDTKVGATSKDDGAANTDKIEAKSSAAKWCRSKGPAWYLPALNELRTICYNKSAINSTLSTIGEAQLSTGYYDSSTEYDSKHIYSLGFDSYSQDGYATSGKGGKGTVRAVRAL